MSANSVPRRIEPVRSVFLAPSAFGRGSESAAAQAMRRLGTWWNLLLLQYANTRLPWMWRLAAGMIYPLVFLFLISKASPTTDSNRLVYLLAGMIVVSLIMGILTKTALAVVNMRELGTIDYFATLPITKVGLVFSLTVSFLVQALPSAIALLLLSRYLLGVTFEFHPLFFLVLPAAALVMASLGTLIGSLAQDFVTSRLISQLCMATMITLSPIFIPVEKFPEILRYFSYFIPSTYAAAAIRDTLMGTVGLETWWNMGILTLVSLAMVSIVTWYLEWQRR